MVGRKFMIPDFLFIADSKMLKTNPTAGINSNYICIYYFNIFDTFNIFFPTKTAVSYGIFHLFVIYLELSAIFNNSLLPQKMDIIFAEFCHTF